jgi:glycosyltransferase involved in cell wall biosynthesis
MSILRLSILGKPMVWTLHDQRAFTGGCHFSAGCVRYENECGSCPQLQKDWFDLTRATVLDQRDAFALAAVVSPSRWLAECAKRSAVFRDTDISVIPYGIDTEIFRPRAKERDAFTFLIGGDNMNVKRKGLHALAEAMRIALRDEKFCGAVESGRVRFASFGAEIELPVPVQNFGRIKSDEQLAQIYAAADVLLLPSLEDNLPNVMIEALCCGTPVLAFNAGGIPDAVQDGVNGRLVDTRDARAFADAIVDLARNPEACAELARNCCDETRARYEIKLQAERYTRVYEEAMERHRSANGRPNDASRLAAIFPSLLEVAQKQKRGKFYTRLFGG